MMKIHFFFLLFLSAHLSFGQGKATYTVKLIDNQLQAMKNTPVTLIETNTKERISKNTDNAGLVVFELTSGEEWAVNVLEMKHIKTLERKEDMVSSGSMNITYDPVRYERTHRAPVDRSKLNLTSVPISSRSVKTTPTMAIIKLMVKQEDKTPLTNFPVNLTCYKLGKTFLGKTDASGYAFFYVPIKNEYEVDIDKLESYTYVDLDENSGEMELRITYQPTKLKETEKNDTIVQQATAAIPGSTGRVTLKLQVKGDEYANEDVYLQMLKSNKVYKAKTNSKGEAFFLLPSKRKYMIHFRYQKDVDVLNYTDMQGIASAEVNMYYRPDPRLQHPENYIPRPEEVLAYDLSKFLEKQFPEPVGDENLGLHLNWANQVNGESEEAFLEVGFNTKKTSSNLVGPPINIALVVDKSGSMEGHDRIDALKIALKAYVGKLKATDRVSLVTFDDKSTVIVPSQLVGDRKLLLEMIDEIQAGGGTDIYLGMVDGYEQVLKNFLPRGTNRVVLLTDGYGITPPEEIIKKSKEYNAKGIEISAVGVGSDYNVSMLTLLASEGGGLLHFAGEAKDMEQVFQKELSSVLNAVAKDVTVEIEYNNQIVFKQLYGFPSSQKSASKAEMKLHNIYAGLSKLALVKFSLNKPTKEIEKAPVIVRMTYFDIKKQKECVTEQKAYLKWSPETGQFELLMEAQHKKLYAIAVLNQTMKVIAEEHAAGNAEKAKKAAEDAIAQYKSIYPNCTDKDVLELVNSIEVCAKGLAQVIYNKKNH